MRPEVEGVVKAKVTILIPARNEEFDIERALAGVLAQDYPHESIEVILVNGGSTDRTVERATNFLAEGGFAAVAVVSNSAGKTPSNLNAGLAKATSAVTCRVDARSVIPADYVRRCVSLLDGNPDLVVVGGAQVAMSRDDSALAVGIARALNNRWGMGLARYRSGAPSGPADTVYLGAFRTEQLRAAGGWDERFDTNQDYELNRRMGRSGVVWFESSLDVGYLPRASIGELFRQYRRFGQWKVRYWRLTGDRPQARQKVLIAAPAVVGAAIASRMIRRPKRTPLVVGAGLVAVAMIEAKGATQPRGGVGSHLCAVAALGSVGLGWTLGVWESLAGRGT